MSNLVHGHHVAGAKLDTSAPIAGPFPFEPFPKIARLRRECVITEKIDGTNASITIEAFDDGDFGVYPASRTRWIDIEHDNMGFAAWCVEHAQELKTLGVGTHFGEWWGSGIQRTYKQDRKRFSLFNTARWGDLPNELAVGIRNPARPACCDVVPVLYQGLYSDQYVQAALDNLADYGSRAAPGFRDPEGIVVFMAASRSLYKVTLKNDEKPKGSTE